MVTSIDNKSKKRSKIKMKNRFLSLLIIPALLLTSCKGEKIGEEKAKELANKITENTDGLEGYGYELKMTAKGNSGKGSEKKSESLSYEIFQDKDENIKFKMKGNDGDQKYDFVIYEVKNETYGKIAYIKEYDLDKKVYNEYVYGKNDTEDYSSLVSTYTSNAFVPVIMMASLADPAKLLESEDFQNGEIVEDEITFKNEVTFYSTGERNLTIEAKRKAVSDNIPEDNETDISIAYSITYDNLLLKKATITAKSNYGNSMEMKFNIDIKKSVKVELPSNWKEVMEKTVPPTSSDPSVA